MNLRKVLGVGCEVTTAGIPFESGNCLSSVFLYNYRLEQLCDVESFDNKNLSSFCGIHLLKFWSFKEGHLYLGIGIHLCQMTFGSSFSAAPFGPVCFPYESDSSHSHLKVPTVG